MLIGLFMCFVSNVSFNGLTKTLTQNTQTNLFVPLIASMSMYVQAFIRLKIKD